MAKKAKATPRVPSAVKPQAPKRRRGARKRSKIDPTLEKRLKVGLIVVVLGFLVAVTFDAVPLIAAKLSIQDRGQQAAAAAAVAARGNEVSPRIALRAYNAALNVIRDRDLGIEIDEKSFLLNPDGTITMTVVQDVPSFLISKYGPLTDQFHVTERITNQGPTILN